MAGNKCGGCGRFISATEGAKCGKCQALYHRVCVGVSAKLNVPPNWRCPECKKNIVRDNRAETPVRFSGQSPPADSAIIEGTSTPCSPQVGSREGLTQTVSPANAAATPPPHGILSADVASRDLSSVGGTNLQVIIEELRAVRAEIQAFRRDMEMEMVELKATLNTCITRIDGLEVRVDALEQRATTSTTSSANVDKIVEDLRREINDRNQDLLANDVEVSNFPEVKTENPAHVIKVIGQKLGVNIEDRDIVSAERVGGRQLNATSAAGPTESRPRPLVVHLARRDLRDQLLAAARVRRGASTADLDMPVPAQRFFLNERLTKANRMLFRRARDTASLLDWKFVWTKQGRILARKMPGDKAQRIRTEDDLSRVFGTESNTA